MTHTYSVTGMTCASCVANVKAKISAIPGIREVGIDLSTNTAVVTMTQHVPLSGLQASLSGTGYSIKEVSSSNLEAVISDFDEEITWKTYLPVFLIFAYILGITLLIQWNNGAFNFNTWMSQFMAGFFLTFSFFKLLDVSAFASSYSTYDIVAQRFPIYGYIYPFIELSLGVLFLIPQAHLEANIATFLVMSFSIVGVVKSMLKKSKFQCACLGAVFKLPLSKITLIEDGLMIIMSLTAILMYYL